MKKNSMFLESKDFLTIWDIAHRWAGYDADAMGWRLSSKQAIFAVKRNFSIFATSSLYFLVLITFSFMIFPH